MSYHAAAPLGDVPGTIIERPVRDDPKHAVATSPQDAIKAAALVQRLLADASNEVTNAEKAIGSARQRRGEVPTSYGNTARWLRERVETLQQRAENEPATSLVEDVKARVIEITESAEALRALAERTH